MRTSASKPVGDLRGRDGIDCLAAGADHAGVGLGRTTCLTLLAGFVSDVTHMSQLHHKECSFEGLFVKQKQCGLSLSLALPLSILTEKLAHARTYHAHPVECGRGDRDLSVALRTVDVGGLALEGIGRPLLELAPLWFCRRTSHTRTGARE